MTVKIGQTIISPWITPVRVVSDSGLSGVYYNGSNNDGVGATFTIAAASLIIESVQLIIGDRILLAGQPSAKENGIYIVKSTNEHPDVFDPFITSTVLERAADQQSLDQYKAGQYVSISAGTDNAGKTFTIVEPLPAALGVNNLNWTVSGGSSGPIVHAGISDFFFGGGTSNSFTVPSMMASWIMVANNSFSTNGIPIATATNGTGTIDVLWASDPGFAFISWIAVEL